MAMLDALQYFLLFIFLTSIECHIWTDCPSEEEIDTCHCTSYLNERHFTCASIRHTVEDYVSRFRENEYNDTHELHLQFFHLPPNEISSNTFEGLNVKELTFVKCIITKWAGKDQAPAFVGLEDTLEYIRIDEGIHRPRSIHRAPAAFTVRHLRKLKTLRLKNNRLTMFKNDWLGDSLGDTLESVTLDNNAIYELSDDVFASLKKLKDINLEFNHIDKVSRNMFPNPATYLTKMDLSDNKIKELPSDFFENMPALTDIDISRNDILIIDETTWRPVWSQLRNLLVKVPNLHCDDEHIEWMFKVRAPARIFGRCGHPEELRGKRFESLIRQKQKEIQ